MKTNLTWCAVPLALGLLIGGPVSAADQDRDRDRMMDQTGDQDRMMDRDRDRLYNDSTVYGWQMMSEQERNEYRNRMQALRTEREREQYQMDHHKMMQERAKQRGIMLQDVPMQKQDGTGPANGMGGGMGNGGGGGGGGR